MKNYLLLSLFFSLLSFGQSTKKHVSEIQKFQTELNEYYKNQKTTPLRGDFLKNFVEHPFFPANLSYRVKANIVKTVNSAPFEMPTSSGKTKKYREYGKLHFKINGEKYTLSVFQNLDLIKKKEYEDYLFLPFRDATNSKETYGGGRYLDLRIAKGKTMIVDFNKSYHPLCAYNAYDYSCPIVPEQNFLPISILAGVKYEDIYFH